MKANYDAASQIKEFREGDMVLAYIPITSPPFRAKYHGPYKVQRKFLKYNYIIETLDHHKGTQQVHVNLDKAL